MSRVAGLVVNIQDFACKYIFWTTLLELGHGSSSRTGLPYLRNFILTLFQPMNDFRCFTLEADISAFIKGALDLDLLSLSCQKPPFPPTPGPACCDFLIYAVAWNVPESAFVPLRV